MTKIEGLIIPESELEKVIVESPLFKTTSEFGNKRKSHPEGTIDVHIRQVLDFIDQQDWQTYRTDLRLLGLLHDLGKYRVVYNKKGYVVEKGHSAHSVDIAREFIADGMLLRMIEVHDKYFHFYNAEISGKFKQERFLKTYGELDLNTLIRFNYADSNNRENDSVKWFEDTCQRLELILTKVYETDLNE